MPAAPAHVSTGRDCFPVHVSQTGGVRADGRRDGGVAVDDLAGKNHLTPPQVPVVEGHLEVIRGVVQNMDGDGALGERRGVRKRQQDADERYAAELAAEGSHMLRNIARCPAASISSYTSFRSLGATWGKIRPH